MYDADKGNILKLAGDGYILRFVCLCLMPLIFFICAFSFRSTFLCCLFCQTEHPTVQGHLSGKEIQECYGKKRIWPLFDSMKSNVLGNSGW